MTYWGMETRLGHSMKGGRRRWGDEVDEVHWELLKSLNSKEMFKVSNGMAFWARPSVGMIFGNRLVKDNWHWCWGRHRGEHMGTRLGSCFWTSWWMFSRLFRTTRHVPPYGWRCAGFAGCCCGPLSLPLLEATVICVLQARLPTSGATMLCSTAPRSSRSRGIVGVSAYGGHNGMLIGVLFSITWASIQAWERAQVTSTYYADQFMASAERHF